jgi:peptidoglycan/xylan/chitin deacetylase (PgdA/CDA1 family)
VTRTLLSNFVRKVRSLAVGSKLAEFMARREPGVRVLMHHGVGTEQYSEEALDQQLNYVAAKFSVLSLSELIERLRAGRPLPRFAVALTFDDGLRNNYTFAFPLLKKYGLPATFFVCPGLVESGEWIWTHDVRARLESDGLAKAIEALSGKHRYQGGADASIVVRWMKGLPDIERRRALESVRHATISFTPSPQQHRSYDLMNWDEIMLLDRSLIGIGSHTHTHPILTQMGDAAIVPELELSWRTLAQRDLLRSPEVLCYPDGACDQRVIAAASQIFKGGCGTKKGIVTDRSSCMELPRIGANSELAEVLWRMWRPSS